VDLIIFPKAYAGGISLYLKPSAMVVVTGKMNRRAEDGSAEILVEDMVPLETAREQYVSELLVRMSPPRTGGGVSSPGAEGKILEDLKGILARYPGQCRVCLEVDTPPQGTVIVETDVTVKPTQELLAEIERRLGHESWRITKIGRQT